MNESLKRKYKFNLKTGHYERKALNEEENTESQQQGQGQQAQQPQQPAPQLPNINTPEVAAMRTQRDQKTAQLDNELKKANDTVNQLQAKYSEATNAFNKAQQDGTEFDMKQVSNVQKQLLQAQIQVEEKTFEKAKVVYDANVAILKTQTGLLESVKLGELPAKYRNLNESNMQAAKVYITSLVAADPQSPLQGMVDVRRAFGISGLLYGKDKSGYFVICVDQEDFDKMYATLQKSGYRRDEIIDAIMPQVFDRRKLID